MFYNVAKASREKERREAEKLYSEENKERGRQGLAGSPSRESSPEMEPGLWGRKYHSRSRSRSPHSVAQSHHGYPDDPRATPLGSHVENENFRQCDNASEGAGHRFEECEEEEQSSFLYVPKCMLGAPLKDFESGQDNTFVVVQNKFGKQTVFRFSKEKSLFLFGPRNFLRKVAVYTTTHQAFEILILLTIVTNCVFMALSNPPEISEYIFAAIYTCEMIIKILAKGFVLHKYSYLRNSWNWLDFSVVILGYVTMAPDIQNLSAIRTFRVLRALKTISTVKGLKAMVNTLIKSMKMMTDVLILTVFFIAIFALIGLQLFLGKLRQRCVKIPVNGSVWDPEYFGALDDEGKLANIFVFNDNEVICGNASTAWNCPAGYVCVPGVGKNPNDYISYDDFLSAMLTTMQVCTLDFWESVYNSVLSAMGEIYMLYFLLTVFLGPFYLLNLVLAVVSASYEMEVNGNPDPEAEKERHAAFRRTASLYSFNGDNFVEYLNGPSTLEEIDGEKRYTVPVNAPAKKKPKQVKEVFRAPEMGDHPSFAHALHVRCFRVVSSSMFEGFIMSCILLNTLLMAVEHFNMAKTLTKILDVFNYIFTTVFVTEMVLKLIGFKLRGYVKNSWNLFDGFLVIISAVDLLLTLSSGLDPGALSVLRVFRLMRVLKLAQSWKTMGQLLSTIASSMGALGNITVILGIVIYIFAVVGMQLFGNYYKPGPNASAEPLRYGFQNFGNSFMMVFRILCGKWIEPQWELLTKSNAASVLFIGMVFVIGRWVVLNLFLALLLSSFGGDALSSSSEDGQEESAKKTRLQRLIEWTKKRKKIKNSFKASSESVIGTYGNNEQNPEIMHVEVFNNNGNVILEAGGHSHAGAVADSSENGGKASVDYNGLFLVSSKSLPKPSQILPLDDASATSVDKRLSAENGSGRKFQRQSVAGTDITLPNAPEGLSGEGPTEPRGNSSSSVKLEIHRETTYIDDCLCSFCYQCSCCYASYLESPFWRVWHNCRYYAKQLVETKYFEFLVLLLIFFSSLTLVFEDVYLQEKPKLQAFLSYCNYFFAVIFTVEFLLKLFALGFIKYFMNAWNLLDVFIVGISLASLFGTSSLKALRSLRGLRPLRAVSRFEGMKVVVNALVYSIPSIANVCLVCLIFWLMFSILGFQLFGGQFWRCVDQDGQKLDHHLVPDMETCLANSSLTNYSWINANINFDNSINGFLALFQTATLEGWFEAMNDAVDARGQNKQPGFLENWAYQLYFVIFIVLGAFFILNLFIGVIIDKFNRLKQQYEDGIGIFLTPSQRNWVNTLKAASLKRPARRLTRPASKWRSSLFDFLHTKYFEFFIMSVILVNMVTMMIQHYGQSNEVTLALEYLNYLFTCIYLIEAIVRLIAMRLEYFKYGMNVFDFVIVVFSIAVIILEKFDKQLPISPGLFRVVRVFRLGRLLRFFEGAKGIRKLLFTIVKSAPALLNIGTLLFLIMFIFTIMAMNLFGNLKLRGALNEVVNFRTFGSSICLLFRLSTAAGWNGVLDAAMVQPPYCDPTYMGLTGVTQGDCGHPLVASIFFTFFIILMVLIIVNMYIAVILENFNQAQSADEAGITEDDLASYYQTWEQFDPKATQFIRFSDLPEFIDQLIGPLRVPKPNYWFLEQSDIPIKDKHRCHCLDVMTALIQRALGVMNEEDEENQSEGYKKVMKKVEDRYRAAFPQRTKEQTKETTRQRLKTENGAARRIQRVFRKHLLLREINMVAHSKSMSLRARERNLEKIEELIAVMWKTLRNRSDRDKIPFADDYECADDTPRAPYTTYASRLKSN